MSNKSIEIRLTAPERLYTKCYHDFLDSTLLNGDQKIAFLCLKRFLDVRTDQGEAYPTIQTLMKMTGWGNQKLIKVINSLVELGIVKKIQRGLTRPNLYVLADKESVWASVTVEEMRRSANETKEEEAIRYLKQLGYNVERTGKEPGSDDEPTTTASKPSPNAIHTNNSKVSEFKSQSKKNAFHNFEQRNYDYDALEKKLEDIKRT